MNAESSLLAGLTDDRSKWQLGPAVKLTRVEEDSSAIRYQALSELPATYYPITMP